MKRKYDLQGSIDEHQLEAFVESLIVDFATMVEEQKSFMKGYLTGCVIEFVSNVKLEVSVDD